MSKKGSPRKVKIVIRRGKPVCYDVYLKRSAGRLYRVCPGHKIYSSIHSQRNNQEEGWFDANV